MTDARPDPESLLARLREQDERSARAKLKVFLGASAGVGKTYAMLIEAHERRRAGVDVVVGLVETHGRRETEALLDGLEVLSRRAQAHRGVTLTEFDLDAALARRPGLVLLDELAHTNAPGSRHAKRWQDVLELLDAGVDVATTLNVQHIESLIDVVAGITGVTVRETVPDSVLERADEVELVDLPPDDLLQRLREGKVYVPAQAERAREGFFRKGNLIALRELALRQTAQRVDAQMESYRRAEGIAEPWAVRERILVCLGDPDTGLRLVRAARRMAAALKAEWIVAHVETPGQVRESPAVRDRLVDVMGLAEDLGAEAVLLNGLRVRDEIVAFARARNVSRVVVGKPTRPWWRDVISASLVSSLVRGATDADVYVIRGDDGEDAPRLPATPASPPVDWRRYLGALPIVAIATLAASAFHGRLELSNLVMFYLLGVVITAGAFGRGPAIVASVLSVALFDFVYVPPRYTFAVGDTQYLITFAVMLVVAVVIGTLTAQLREQAERDRNRARRSTALQELTRELAGRRSPRDLLVTAVERLDEVFECRSTALLPDAGGQVRAVAGEAQRFTGDGHERGVAQWVFDHRQPAGLGTDTLPGALALHVPLVGSSNTLGVIALAPSNPRRLRDPERTLLLDAFASQIALSLERGQLAESAERARVDAEAERARNALLSSVSHDLRTPLAVIAGAASSLRDDDGRLDARTRHELSRQVVDEAQRLNRLVGDLLDMTRLESGALVPHREWHSLEDVVGAVLGRLESRFGSREVRFQPQPDLPLIAMDDVLVGQAVTNLVENALAYTPDGSAIELDAVATPGGVRLDVADRGPGIPEGGEEKLFEKFWRGSARRDRPGAGLGLTIARGLVEAHGGRLTAQRRSGGGTVFRMELPRGGDPPTIEREPAEAEGGGS